ncbi:hypothetical protein HMPREF6123_0420 [Oribacterium sinus F0268]|jgi:hypothetical protein|uniref:Uncharacterized protein n=2 Tax=Oribacterium sinus TaxID=237576 RepID=C2KVA1_9FIRM|nr:hypothetical protein HMPREF6123_0420 [Oribacterium sinus F0268]
MQDALQLKGGLTMSYLQIFALLGAFLIPFILLWLICYGLEAYALYTLAKNNGQEDKAILAFIPYINRGLYAYFAGDQVMFGTPVPTIASAAIMGLLPLLGGFIGGIVNYICIVVIIIVSFYNYKAVYSKMSSVSDSTLFGVLAAVISLCRVIFIFLHRNDILVEDGEIVE